jgi:hypothetical protein
MSRAATAKKQASPDVLTYLTGGWNFTKLTGSLMGKLHGFEIISQQPESGILNTDSLLGGVKSTDSLSVFLLDGSIQLVIYDDQPQQVVSFEVIIGGVGYYFGNGVLSDSPDGWKIDRGKIFTYPASLDIDSEVEDGTWSAQAQPGPIGAEFGKGKRRGRAGLRRHQPQ